MGTGAIQKVPFTLIIPNPSEDFCVDVESPVGVATLGAWGIPSIGWLGGPSTAAIYKMAALYGNHILGMDTDKLRYDAEGNQYQPGEKHTQKLKKVYGELGIRYKEITVPPRHKDVDTWVAREGITPLLRQARG
jgi:hypothetical protein